MADGIVDWRRVGELLRTGTHKYTIQQLIPRGFVALCTVGAGYYGFQNDENNRFSSATCMAALAFAASHTLVMSPLLWKRLHSQIRINSAELAILELIKDDSDTTYTKEINLLISDIHYLKRTSLSHTLGEKARKMEDLLENVREHYHGPSLSR